MGTSPSYNGDNEILQVYQNTDISLSFFQELEGTELGVAAAAQQFK